MTAIEWTDKTWSPIIGCSRVSAGCTNCYAERFVHRGLRPEHRGLTVLRSGRPGWTGEVRFFEERLVLPLRWRKPRRIFVNPMADLFHESVSDEQIEAVFGLMHQAGNHTFQILTKRPARMRSWVRQATAERCLAELTWRDVAMESKGGRRDYLKHMPAGWEWPLPNVWLGVTAEDQAAADERIPLLLDTPAAVRFVSQEPALELVRYRDAWLLNTCPTHETRSGFCSFDCPDRRPALSWVIVGGESGPKARPFDLGWARSTISQCRGAGVPVFFKQAGSRPVDAHDDDDMFSGERRPLKLRDRKGGDLDELPRELAVRQFPEVRS